MGDAGSVRPTRPLGVRIGYTVGVTSPRRVALLAAVVCGLVLSVTVPLRNYVGQRGELAAVYEQQHILADKIAELERRRALLADPQHVETQARERLRYVHPGEAPYLVQLPPGISAAATGSVEVPTQLWYRRLWTSINGG
ncbi:MAG: septum formation initiator family protein [Actinomycetota bacterium]|nr:septum formation initiator family protein [Actinomycetota bacterium]